MTTAIKTNKPNILSDMLAKTFINDQNAEFIGNQCDVARMSLETVVDVYYRQESGRSRTREPEMQAEVRIDSNRWPTQLLESLDRFAKAYSNRSIATLTKCATYKIAYWFYEMGLETLVSDFESVDKVITEIPNPFLLSTLSESFNVKTFRLPEMTVYVKPKHSLATIGWFKSSLIRYASALSMFDYQLFGAGMEWFLTTARNADNVDSININARYRRDAKLLELHVTERKLYLAYMKQVAEARKCLGEKL